MEMIASTARCGTSILLTLAVVLAYPLGNSALVGQTIRGRLLDRETDLGVELGLVMMFRENGDSVTATLTEDDGYFSVTAPSGGSFVLVASAFGYEETPAGVFELGEDGQMSILFRIPPAPMAIDEIVVALDRPALEHRLVRNGFVRRATRGLGHFITPREIEESPARTTSGLLRGIPGVSMRPTAGGFADFAGETVIVRGPMGGWCVPTLYLDGAWIHYDGSTSLDAVVPLAMVEAVEIYRRPSEIPIEYSATRAPGAGGSTCGVLVIWTKTR